MSFVLVDLLILGFLKLLLTDVSMYTPLICVHLFFNVLIPFSTTDYDLASIFLYLYLQLLNIPFPATLLFEFFFVCLTPRTRGNPVDCIHS